MDDKRPEEQRDGANAKSPQLSETIQNLKTAYDALASGPRRGTTLERVLPALRNGYRIGRLCSGVEIFIARSANIGYVGADNTMRCVHIGDQVMMKFRDKFMPLVLESIDILAEDWIVLTEPMQ